MKIELLPATDGGKVGRHMNKINEKRNSGELFYLKRKFLREEIIISAEVEVYDWRRYDE